MPDSIQQRLRRTRPVPERPFKSDAVQPINPDGPEAADALDQAVEALTAIRELVSKRQLPITNQVFEIADATLVSICASEGSK